MENGKASGPSDVCIELIRALGDEEVDWVYQLMSEVWNKEEIPHD